MNASSFAYLLLSRSVMNQLRLRACRRERRGWTFDVDELSDEEILHHHPVGLCCYPAAAACETMANPPRTLCTRRPLIWDGSSGIFSTHDPEKKVIVYNNSLLHSKQHSKHTHTHIVLASAPTATVYIIINVFSSCQAQHRLYAC